MNNEISEKVYKSLKSMEVKRLKKENSHFSYKFNKPMAKKFYGVYQSYFKTLKRVFFEIYIDINSRYGMDSISIINTSMFFQKICSKMNSDYTLYNNFLIEFYYTDYKTLWKKFIQDFEKQYIDKLFKDILDDNLLN